MRRSISAVLFVCAGVLGCGGDDTATSGSGGAGGTTGGATEDHAGAGGTTGGSAGSGGSGGGAKVDAGDASMSGDVSVEGSPTADVTVSGDAPLDRTGDALAEADGPLGPMSCPSLPAAGAPVATDAATEASVDGDLLDAGEGGATIAAPATLVDTGLYCDISTFTVAPGLQLFRPRFELWSDGGEKMRWIQLPAGAKIDTTDPDHWSFPVGTKVWKEFKYLGKRVETRLIHRYGPGANDFLFAAYRWNTAGTAATLVDATGAQDVAPMTQGAEPLMHDIPTIAQCNTCHGFLPEHLLGFSAIQLSHSLGGTNIASLVRDNALTVPPEAGGYTVPGDDVDQAALGYLHANCGNCHTDVRGPTFPRFRARLLVGDTTVASTDIYKTAVNVPHTWVGAGGSGVGRYRIQGGNAQLSELFYRTGVRGTLAQMPPLATKIAHTEGRAALEAWINRLPPPSMPEVDDGGDAGEAGGD